MSAETTAPCREPRLAALATDYALGRLRPGKQEAFENHLAGCPACAGRMLEMERGLDRLYDDAALAEERYPVARWAALAAGITILLLGYPAFLGLYRLPRVEERASRLHERQAQLDADLEALRGGAGISETLGRAVLPDQPIEIHFLTRPTRGAEPLQTFTLDPNETAFYLGVVMDSADLVPGQRYRFEIRFARQVVWWQELAGAEALRSLDSAQGSVIFPVPGRALVEGSHVLSVRGSGASEDEAFFQRTFLIAR